MNRDAANRTDRPTTLIIGAGLAGLRAARGALERGDAVRVIDKGRRPGGRMSTRRITLPDGDTLQWDHGPPVFDGTDPLFLAQCERWAEAGVAVARGRHWMGTPGMAALIEHEAAECSAAGADIGFDIEALGITQVPAAEAEADGNDMDGRWRITAGTPDGPIELSAHRLVLAVPSVQAARLLAEANDPVGTLSALATRVAAVEMAPRWTALLRCLGEPTGALIFPGPTDASHPAFPIEFLVCDTDKPGRAARVPSGTTCWVVHAREMWTREHLELDKADAAARLRSAFVAWAAEAEGVEAEVVDARAHRWRYAGVVKGLAMDAGCHYDAGIGRGLGLCGDWCDPPDQPLSLGIARGVEHAWRSGEALAAALASA